MPYETLPLVNAILNSIAATLIVTGYVLIRNRKIAAHKACMLSAVVVSALFLASYLTYHFGPVDEKKFQGQGWIRPFYFTMLVSHILLAIAVVPLVLVTVVRGLRNQLERHVRIARVTVWIWLYVSVTGILVYLALYQSPWSRTAS